ncbi:MAG: DUF1648 domain-containing protein, partial [Chloroflexi bacterium]|nr:DUF1648 domain-containing protein [Chloroflexota bacterium]
SRGFRGVGWPGYMNGRLRLKRLGWLVSLSTEPLQRQLIVVTETQCYGISPRDPTEFLHHYVQYRALGAVAAIEQGVERNLLLRLPLWSDLAFWGAILVAFVANVALFGLIMARYGALPERIPLHFNAQGEPLRIASKAWLLLVPGIGAAALFVNALLGAALHRWERLGARLLVFAALGVQAIVWSAALVVLAHGRG